MNKLDSLLELVEKLESSENAESEFEMSLYKYDNGTEIVCLGVSDEGVFLVDCSTGEIKETLAEIEPDDEEDLEDDSHIEDDLPESDDDDFGDINLDEEEDLEYVGESRYRIKVNYLGKKRFLLRCPDAYKAEDGKCVRMTSKEHITRSRAAKLARRVNISKYKSSTSKHRKKLAMDFRKKLLRSRSSKRN